MPRDRNGTFEPQVIGKHQTRFAGFDAKILSMYGLGMTVRDIQGHLHDMYGDEVSTRLISDVTESIQEEVKAWQDRPLEAFRAGCGSGAEFIPEQKLQATQEGRSGPLISRPVLAAGDGFRLHCRTC